jgi:L-ascorbate metabolism protein UlaG (beta-lactamase superfamily)
MRSIIWIVPVIALLLTAMPVHATGLEDSVPLVGVQSGPLEAGGDIWFFIFGAPAIKALGVTLNYFPAERASEPRVTFEVWAYQNSITGPVLSQIGQGTPSGQPLGVKYWRGAGGSGRVYFLRLINGSPYGIDYALAITGDAYPPPRLAFAPTPLVQEFERREAARLTKAITWRGRDSFLIRGSIVLYIDPYRLSGGEPKADLILITQENNGHCSPLDVAKIIQAGTAIVTTSSCREKLGNAYDITIVEPSNRLEVKGVAIQAIPAYNIDDWLNPSLTSQARGFSRVGYLFTLDGIKYYLAGDTGVIPGMEGLAPDVALLPVGGQELMTVEEAIAALQLVRPKVAVPMGYSGAALKDILRFRDEALVLVVILEQQP